MENRTLKVINEKNLQGVRTRAENQPVEQVEDGKKNNGKQKNSRKVQKSKVGSQRRPI